MFSESAEFYDLIYSGFKNYKEEARGVAAVVEQHRPGARDVLDVGCGTGQHALALTALGYSVDGVDLEPEFVRQAQEKNPRGVFARADMAELNLGKEFDVVLCLFSSIAYLKTLGKVSQALSAFARHIRPGGVVLVEPWFTPEKWNVGHVEEVRATAEGVSVVRMSYSDRRGSISHLHFHYLIGRERAGVEYRTELHELGLFTVEEMKDAFEEAGLRPTFDPGGLIGRGLYVARR